MLVVGAPAFWRIDESPQLAEYLQRYGSCILEEDQMQVYDLAPKRETRPQMA